MEQIYLRPFARFMELADLCRATNHATHVLAAMEIGDLDQFPGQEPVEHLIDSAICELQSFHRLFTRTRAEVDEDMVHRFFEHAIPNQASRLNIVRWLLKLQRPAATEQEIETASAALSVRAAQSRISHDMLQCTRLEKALFRPYRNVLLRERVPAVMLPYEPAFMDRLAVHAVFEFLYSHTDTIVDPLPLRDRVHATINHVALRHQEIENMVAHAGQDGIGRLVEQADEEISWAAVHMAASFEAALYPELQNIECPGHTYIDSFLERVNIQREYILNELRQHAPQD